MHVYKGEMSRTVCVTLTLYSSISVVFYSEVIGDVVRTRYSRRTPWRSVTKIPLLTQDANKSSSYKHQQIIMQTLANYVNKKYLDRINHNPITYIAK